MPHALAPRQIDADEFVLYTSHWRELIDGSNPSSLNACFKSSGKFLNYVFLPRTMIESILLESDTVEVRAKFALVPRSTNGTPIFTMVFYGISDNQILTSHYYMAGVAIEAATIYDEDKILTKLPFLQAYAAIKSWEKETDTGTLSTNLFETGYGRLRGYTHKLQDFQEVAESGQDALWLNFALSNYNVINLFNHEAPSLFGTVLSLNTMPPEEGAGELRLSQEDSYYDVSKPCPPAC